MKQVALKEKPLPIYKLAKNLSLNSNLVWYVLTHPTRENVAACQRDMGRYMRIGYKVLCCYFNGIRHKNAFWDKSRGCFEFTER